MALAPFLTGNKTALAFTLSHKPSNPVRGNPEEFELALFNGGSGVFSSGSRSLESFRGFTKRFSVPAHRAKLKLMLSRRSFSMGRQVVTIVRLPLPQLTYKNGSVSGVVNGNSLRASSAVAKLRARAPRGFYNPRIRIPSTPRSSSLRPNPFELKRPFVQVQQNNINGFPFQLLTLHSIYAYYRTWTGVRTPGWGKKKPKVYPDNPHTVRIWDVYEDLASEHHTHINGSGIYALDYSPYSVRFPTYGFQPHESVAEFNALKRLISNAQSGIQANLAQNIAQVSQLSNLIVGNSMLILKSLRQLRRGNISGAIGTLTSGQNSSRWRGSKGTPSKTASVASNWLQLQYGWKPLLSDIEGFLKIMVNLSGNQDFVQRVASSASVTRVREDTFPPPQTFAASSVGKTSVVTKTTCKFSVRYRMDNPLLSLFAQTGFTNPINLAWEILPFSFVADWFLPIGSYLEALSAWDGMTFLGGSKVLFTKSNVAHEASYHGPHFSNPNNVVVNFRAAFRAEQIIFDRIPLSGFPSSVIPSVNILGLSGGNRALNAIALLGVAFGRRG